MINDLITQVGLGRDLSDEEVQRAVVFLTSEFADDTKADFLRALSAKGETSAEIAAFASAFLDRALPIDVTSDELSRPLIDVCGTGGDRLGMFNVSTTSSFVIAAGGAAVAKHGNRGVSSRSGGADVLEALGVKIDLEPAAAKENLVEHGFTFLFAQRYHPAFKSLATVRRQLATEGIVTVFNLLGPLLNPARPANQLVGIFRPELLRKYVEVLRLLGRTSAWAVNGTAENDCGMDEISILGPTRVARLRNELIDEFELEPAQFVSGPVSEGILTGGDANENAATTTGILNGEIRDARRDIVVANAAAAFVIADLAPDLETGIQRAREEIDSGRAAAVLKSLVDAA